MTTIRACKAGLGIAYLLEARIAGELARGELRIVLEENAYIEDPSHIYYGSRRYNYTALLTLINIVRRRWALTKVARRWSERSFSVRCVTKQIFSRVIKWRPSTAATAKVDTTATIPVCSQGPRHGR